jgi:uncharacterized protein
MPILRFSTLSAILLSMTCLATSPLLTAQATAETLSSIVPAKVTAINVTPTQLVTPTGKIYGVLEIPAMQTPMPLVLIIAGSGPTDRNGNNPQMTNNSLKMLAEGLHKMGIATLRYDKRGVAKSAAAAVKESDLRFEHYVDDARGWIQMFQADRRFSSLNIIGHSEGALMGAIVAQEPEVDHFVSLAGAGVPAYEVLATQLQAQPEGVWKAAEPVLNKLIKGELEPNPPAMLQALFRPSVQPYLISWFKYDPRESFKKLRTQEKSVLIVQGNSDLQVRVEDAISLRKAYPEAKFSIVNGMNHILKSPMPMDNTQANLKTYNNPQLPLTPALVPTLAQFIKE